MAVALRLAERGLGRTWPNPAVGCVVVRHGQIVGRGWTQPGGRPHAEVEALRRAGAEALGATAYISLEPCAHYGQTPPCTMALLHAGIRRAVIATADPDPRVDGRGIDQLRQAGVEVALGLGQDEATQLNAGFFLRVRAGRPLVTLKLATSLDGRIATRTGASQWITGEAARRRAHHLRATHDAIMIGSGTALADDPSLTCRLPGPGGALAGPRGAGRPAAPRARQPPGEHGARRPDLGRHPHRRQAGAARGARALRRRGADGAGAPPGRRWTSERPSPPWRRAGSPGCWSRAAARSRRRSCAPGWSTGWCGSRRRW